jgi:Tfp pilus assembly protein PilV
MRPKQTNGFIFLEALVAMSFILGAWLGAMNTYQMIAMRFITQETKRVQLRKALDIYEIQERIRAIQSP